MRPRGLVGIFLALLGLLALTVALAFVNLGRFNLVAALAISGLKALLVVVFFMELGGLGGAQPLLPVFASGGLFWLLILLSLTATDYLTR